MSDDVKCEILTQDQNQYDLSFKLIIVGVLGKVV